MGLSNKIRTPVKDLEIVFKDFQKYFNSDDLPELFNDTISKFLRYVNKEEVLTAFYIYPVYAKQPDLHICNESLVLNLSNVAYSFVSKSEYIIVFATTLAGIQDKIYSLAKNDKFIGNYLADITCTVILEKSITAFNLKIAHEFNKARLKIGSILSPGNCGWSIKEQEKIFKLLPDKLSIELNEAYMMKPVKSMTGIIGIGKNISFKHSDCSICQSKNCLYRKKQTTKSYYETYY